MERLSTGAMSSSDFYASPFGVVYSAYMERPRLSRLIGRLLWGGDSEQYYEAMQAIAQMPDGGTVVDCPIGAGPALRALEPTRSLRYVGYDLSPSMLRRARKRARLRGLGQVELERADATRLPLDQETVDLYLSFWGLHCFDDPVAALKEAARVLKPGGRLLGATFVRGEDSLRQRLLVRSGTGDFGTIGDDEDLDAWLRSAGFETIALDRSGPMRFFDCTLPEERPGSRS